MEEFRVFEPDNETTPAGQNVRLSTLLAGAWVNFHIVSVSRISIGTQAGWLAVCRN